MKFIIDFKMPNALSICLDIAWANDYSKLERRAMKDCASNFIKEDECIKIEFDTETETAKVLPLSKSEAK